MEFKKDASSSQSFEFEQHPIGWYAFQVLEGVDIKTKENSPGMSLMIPLQSFKALKPKDKADGVPGDAAAAPGRHTHFIVLVTKEGVEMKKADDFISSLLVNTDLMPKFIQKFPSGVEITDKRLHDMLKMNLPGKIFKAEIAYRKNSMTGEMQANIKRWDKYSKSVPKLASEKPADQPKEEAQEPVNQPVAEDGDDW